ncbi:MAG: hypothetical protein Kow0059_21740 [Candidatus Sumerlaeia bacterium]
MNTLRHRRRMVRPAAAVALTAGLICLAWGGCVRAPKPAPEVQIETESSTPAVTPTPSPVPPAGGLPPGSARRDDCAGFFNLNGITPFHDAFNPDADVQRAVVPRMDRNLKAIAGLGARMVRTDFWWSAIEPEPGRLEWDLPDRIINQIHFNGLEPLPILTGNAAWSPGRSPDSPDALEDFGRFVRAVVARYKNRVKYWEIWNEPNINPYWVPTPDPRRYAALLQAAYTEAKAADPDCVIVGICSAGADLDFIEGVYRAGGGAWMDAVSFHHYGPRDDEATLERELLEIRAVMNRFGDASKPLFITESGISTGPSEHMRAYSEDEQAAWVVKEHLVALAGGVERFFYFKLNDDAPAGESGGHWGLLRSDLSEKPAAAAYRAMTERLAGAAFIGRAGAAALDKTKEADAQVLVFYRDGEWLAAGWTRRDGEPLEIQLPADEPVRVEDTAGGTIAHSTPQDGSAPLRLTADPRWFRGLSPRAALLAGLRLSHEPLILSRGETIEAALFIPNPTSRPVTVDLVALNGAIFLQNVDFFFPGVETLECPPGAVISTPVRCSLQPQPPSDAVTRLTYRARDKSVAFGVPLIQYEAFGVRLAARSEGGAVTLETTVMNNTPQPQSGTVTWRFGNYNVPGERTFENLESGRSVVLKRRIRPSLSATELVATVKSKRGGEGTGRLRMIGTPRRHSDFQLDGSLADWLEVPSIVLTPKSHQWFGPEGGTPLPPEKLSASVKVAWTTSTLWLAADVSDATPAVNPHTGGDLWMGDSLQVFLAFDGATGDDSYGERHYQIGLSPGNGGKDPFVYNWHSRGRQAQPEPPRGAVISDARIAVRMTPRGYMLEAAIPLSEFRFNPRPNDVIGFDVTLNNINSPDAETFEDTLIWSGDDQNHISPRRWGAAVIVWE